MCSLCLPIRYYDSTDIEFYTVMKIKQKKNFFSKFLCDVASFMPKKTGKDKKRSSLKMCDGKKGLIAGKKCGPP